MPAGFEGKASPMGVSFTGTACMRAALIEIAYAYRAGDEASACRRGWIRNLTVPGSRYRSSGGGFLFGFRFPNWFLFSISRSGLVMPACAVQKGHCAAPTRKL
jgi:hypothetical protein